MISLEYYKNKYIYILICKVKLSIEKVILKNNLI